MRALVAAALGAATVGGCGGLGPADATLHRLDFQGVSRSYRVHVPKTLAAKPALLLVLHGWKGSGAEIERRTRFGFDRLADRDGFVVAYPDAVAGQWRSGHAGETVTSDDVGFLSALIDALAWRYGVDSKQVYVTGFSNGASMTYRLACERPDRIAAIAPVSGGLAQELMRDCASRSKQPIPLLLIHGTADPVVRFDSGELEGNLAYWTRRNGCSTTPTVSRLRDADPRDGTRTRIERYPGCRDSAEVVLYAVEGGGHHWPGGDEPIRLDQRGPTARDFDAADLIWDFMKRHAAP